MDKQIREAVRAVLPSLPLLIRTTILHLLRRTPASHYLDLRTELTVTILRALMAPSKPQTVTSLQAFSIRDPGVKGRIWISHYACPAPPEPELRDALMAVVARLGEPHATFRTPALVAVEAEWTGYRADVAPKAPLPALSERERYHEMSKECSRPTTILYFHGGAFYLCDPATHRATTKKLAKLTGGRCYSVRYRLAPQEPFPAALLDALVSYFALLYPPPDAYHEPVKPEHIVFAGDSAGGNLALALLKLLQELRRDNSHILWHGTPRVIPLPAGVATSSPWVDMVQSAPTWDLANETPFDYIPKPETMRSLPIPVCAAWPVDPPRKNMYIEDSLSFHPLATLIMAQDWKGSPPIYICTGWEILAYEDKFLAQKLHAEGVAVRFEEYEAMAHCFALMFTKLPEARRGFDGWADFINQVVEDPSSVTSSAVTIEAKTLREVPRRFEDLCDEPEDDVRKRVLETASRRDLSAKL